MRDFPELNFCFPCKFLEWWPMAYDDLMPSFILLKICMKKNTHYYLKDNLVVKVNTAQKMKFSINNFFSKFEVTFTEEILHGKLHFSCNETSNIKTQQVNNRNFDFEKIPNIVMVFPLLLWTSKHRLGRYLLKLFMFIFLKLNSPSNWNDTNS